MPPFTHISNTVRDLLADADLEPTRVLRDFRPSRVLARQATTTVTVVADSGDSGAKTSSNSLSTGAIVGIVLGSVFGFLLLLWLLRSFTNLGAPPSQQRQEAWYDDVSPDRYRRKKHHHHHHHHSRGRDYSRPRRSGSQMRAVPVVVADRSSRSPRRPSATYSYERG